MAFHVRILAGKVDHGAGSHLYHQQLARRLAARGHKVSLVCFESVPEVRDCADIYEVRPLPYHQKRLVWRFASLLQHGHCGRSLRALNLPPADVVVGGEHLFLQGHHRIFLRTPWIYLPHSLVVDLEIRSYDMRPLAGWVTRSVYTRAQRWALRHADRTLRFTRYACDALTSRYGRSVRPRFFVNPMGVDLPDHGRTVSAGGTTRLLFVGRLVGGKGIELALSALAGLRNFDWRFDIVGSGECRAGLEQQAARLGLQDRVHFHGHQADPGTWYGKADLLLFPSRLESLGLVVLEAMGYGVPCLAIRSDGKTYRNANDEIITDGHTGLLANGPAGFAQGLETALASPEHLVRLGKRARRHIAENHTWGRHLDRYEEVFDDITAGRKHTAVEGAR
jgi:glycosyltransferase involved in cell wall biosynthesis